MREDADRRDALPRVRASASEVASVSSAASLRPPGRAGARPSACFRESLVALIFVPTLAIAGVVTDGSVGAAGAIGKVGNDFPIPSSLGTKVGGNLFHSFSQFNLTAGESGTFSGPNDVSNILARVTGGSPSSIDGTLRSTIPGANLFFINPKGVLFGPNARLDIDGSFTTTTADYLKLSDGSRFSATPPANEVLTAAPVSAFGFLAPRPAAISAKGSFLAAKSGAKLSFVGGDLSLTAGAQLLAPSGHVDLWSANSPGEISAANGAGGLGGSVRVDRSLVDTTGDPGGTIVIRGGRLTVDHGFITSVTKGATAGGPIDLKVSGNATIQSTSRVFTSTSGAGAAGDVSLEAASVNLSDFSILGSLALDTATASATSGKVRINTGTLLISNEGEISASTFGLAAGGSVDVQAKSISIIGVPSDSPTDVPASPATGIFSTTNASGAGGALRVRTDTLRIMDGGSISADTFGLGKGGDVDVKAQDIFIAARGALFKTGIFADSGGVPDKISPGGDGGSIHIAADRLQITDGGLISTKSVGAGSGGDTTIEVRELLISKGKSTLITGIAVDAAAGPGSGGNLRINADDVRVLDGGRISASAGDAGNGVTTNTGPAGNISVHARNIFLAGPPDEPTGIRAESVSSSAAGGAGGDIEVVADHLLILNGARISASTFGGGAGGDVLVRAQDAFIYGLTNDQLTGIAAESLSTTVPGAGGSVRVEVPTLTLSGFGTIAANTFGPGAGGAVTVIGKVGSLLGGGRVSADTAGLGAGGSVDVKIGKLAISGAGTRISGIFSESKATGQGGPGGRVQVQSDIIRLTNLGSIAATSASSGAGGSVMVKARQLTLDGGATIEASATGAGIAGSVAITVRQPLTLTGGSAVRTTSTISDAGTVEITSATDIDLTDSTVAVSALVGNAGQVSLHATGTISLINSSVVAEAGLNGGNVFIDPEFVLLDHSRISANAILGAGGNILIIADTFLASSSAVTASSQASVQGSVQIQSLNVDLSGALVVLPTGLVDVSTQLREQCARRLGMDFSSFLVLGRGGTEATPDEPLPSNGAPVSGRPKARRP